LKGANSPYGLGNPMPAPSGMYAFGRTSAVVRVPSRKPVSLHGDRVASQYTMRHEGAFSHATTQ
jgi:hypothetical protein